MLLVTVDTEGNPVLQVTLGDVMKLADDVIQLVEVVAPQEPPPQGPDVNEPQQDHHDPLVGPNLGVKRPDY